MAQSAKSLMRAGLISPKASAKLAVLRGTRAQKGRMATFDHKHRDEGDVKAKAIAETDGRHIDRKQHGKGAVGRGQEMPSRGGSAGKGATYQPKKQHIDQFPAKISRVSHKPSTFKGSPSGTGAFPSGTDMSGSGSTPVAPASRGGVRAMQRGNAYGARNSRP